MRAVVLDINADAVVRHSARLGELSKSALPVSIRQALNRAAFDVKTVTMPETSRIFIHRMPTFFKSQSKVDPAIGFDIHTMEAVVGFIPGGADKEKGHATEDLEEQEHGGNIDSRAFIPLRTARVGRNWRRNVRTDLRLSKIRRQIFDSENENLHGTANDKEAFTLSAIYAQRGGFVIGNIKNSKGHRMLMRIDSVKRKGKDTEVHSTPIYSVEGGRSVKPKATHFMEKASNMSAAKIERFYRQEADKRINRLK